VAREFLFYAVYHGLRSEWQAAFNTMECFGFMQRYLGFNSLRITEQPGQQPDRTFRARSCTKPALMALGFAK
jgi:hypothetical protein